MTPCWFFFCSKELNFFWVKKDPGLAGCNFQGMGGEGNPCAIGKVATKLRGTLHLNCAQKDVVIACRYQATIIENEGMMGKSTGQ